MYAAFCSDACSAPAILARSTSRDSRSAIREISSDDSGLPSATGSTFNQVSWNRAWRIARDYYADVERFIGVYVGTRAENLGACLEIVAEQIEVVAAGDVTEDELARAKENLKGRIMLSMESTANRMSRLGKSLITDTELLSIERIMAEIDAVEPEALAELAGVLLAPERLSAAGIGPNEERFMAAIEHVNPGLARAA